MKKMGKNLMACALAGIGFLATMGLAGCAEEEVNKGVAGEGTYKVFRYLVAEDHYIVDGEGTLHKGDVYSYGVPEQGYGFGYDIYCVDGYEDIIGGNVQATSYEPKNYTTKCDKCFGD